MSCWGSALNLLDLFLVDNPFSKHLLSFLQSQKHTTFIYKEVDTTMTPVLEKGGITEKQT